MRRRRRLTATWDSPVTSFPIGSNSTLTFDVTLDASVSPGQVITNTGNVAWTSLPGDVTTPQSAYNGLSTERTGDTTNPGGVENDYRATGTANVTVASTPTKSIRLTSEAHTGVRQPERESRHRRDRALPIDVPACRKGRRSTSNCRTSCRSACTSSTTTRPRRRSSRTAASLRRAGSRHRRFQPSTAAAIHWS